jgi:hypothetical protein
LLGLGAATTVGVAWGIAATGFDLAEVDQRLPSCFQVGELPHPTWVDWTPVKLGWTFVAVKRGRFEERWSPQFPVLNLPELQPNPERFEDWESAPLQVHPPIPETRDAFWGEHHFGWPFPAMFAVSHGLDLDAPVLQFGCSSLVTVGWGGKPAVGELPFLSRHRPGRLDLPVGIMWQGFAMNTILYASAWWSVLFGVGITRRALRRRRGQCVVCAYSRAGLAEGAVCPECGS